MPRLSIQRLLPHPDNANRMNAELLRTLSLHIERTGRYPPIIVRPHPQQTDHYEILDGHHRVQVLQQLGHMEVDCRIWDVADDEATLLLLTLNRLEGSDDPQKRGALLQQLHSTLDLPEIAELVPEDCSTIERLLALNRPAPNPAAPVNTDDMPQAVTFFLTEPQKRALDQRLRCINTNRSRALVQLLELEPNETGATSS